MTFSVEQAKVVKMPRNGVPPTPELLYQASGRLNGKGTRDEMIQAAHEILDYLAPSVG